MCGGSIHRSAATCRSATTCRGRRRVRRLARALFGAVISLGMVVTPVIAEEFTAEESREILQRVDEQVSYKDRDFAATYAVTQERPGEGESRTVMNMYRRDREDRYTIIIREPSQDRGKGYVRIGENLWLYDPADGRFTRTRARDRFENTNARNSDFTQSTLAEDYRIVGHTEEQLGVYETDVYDLEAVTDEVTYPAMRVWIDENGLVRKFEDYSASGEHMRTTAIPNYRRVDGRFVPVRMVIQDELRGREIDGEFRNERTVISVSEPSFDDVSDMVFTRAYLEQVAD